MKNGFIYPFFDALVKLLYYCNLVELFKYIAQLSTRLANKDSQQEALKEKVITSCNVAIDVYQIFKFGILMFFWVCQYSDIATKIIIYYLIASNLYTYFYYHVWGSHYKQRVDRATLNRKFINSILAIAFYLLSYSYLYQIHYNTMILWPNNVIDYVNAIYLSVSTAFTLTYGGFQPLTQNIRMVFMSELINTFLFFTIILSNSIPNHAGSELKK